MGQAGMIDRGRPPAFASGPVMDALAELRYATPAQILAHIGEGLTLKQVTKALSNAIGKNRVCSTRFAKQKGVKGGRMATYWLAGNPPPEDYRAPVPKAQPEDDSFADVDTSWLFTPNRRSHRPQYAYPSIWHYAEGRSVKLTWGDGAR